MSNYADINYKIHIKNLILSSIVGYVIFILNFPSFSQKTIDAHVSIEWLNSLFHMNIELFRSIFDFIIGNSTTAFFQKIMTANFILFLLYLLFTTFLSIRHLKIQGLLYSCLGIVFGYTSVHIISWLSNLLISIVSSIFSFILYLKSIILKLLDLLILIFNSLLVDNIYITISVVTLIIGYVYRKKPIKALKIFAFMVCTIFIAITVIPLIYTWIVDSTQTITNFISNIWFLYIRPLISSIIFLISKVIALCVYILILSFVFSTIGNVVLDQLKSSKISGYGGKALLLSGFSIGSAFSIVTLSSIATVELRVALNNSLLNSFNLINDILSTNIAPILISTPTEIFLKTMPESVENFINLYLSNSQAPIVDSLILLIVLVISTLSIFKGIFSTNNTKDIKNTDINFMPRDFIIIFSLLFASITLIFLQAILESD